MRARGLAECKIAAEFDNYISRVELLPTCEQCASPEKREDQDSRPKTRRARRAQEDEDYSCRADSH